jgi:ankyrin repeat protein
MSLHLACLNNNYTDAKSILVFNIGSINEQNNNNNTPLMYACQANAIKV